MTYGNDVFRAGMRALALDTAARTMTIEEAQAFYRAPRVTPELAAEWARPDGIVTVAEPCECDYCALMQGSQWTAEQLEGFAAARRDRVMAGVDMPGRIVDDVRPDQRGES